MNLAEKRKEWKKFRETGSELNSMKYTRERNELRQMTRQNNCKDCEAVLVENVCSNPKGFWKYVNGKLKVKSAVSSREQKKGISETGEKKEAF